MIEKDWVLGSLRFDFVNVKGYICGFMLFWIWEGGFHRLEAQDYRHIIIYNECVYDEAAVSDDIWLMLPYRPIWDKLRLMAGQIEIFI